MDPKSEMKALAAKSSTILANVKALGRDFTDSELTELEGNTDRIFELKAAIGRGEKAAEVRDSIGATGAGETHYPNGLGGEEIKSGTADRRGFLTPSSLKATSHRAALEGIKSLVAGGSTVTPVELDTNPVPLGQAGLGLLGVIPVRVRDGEQYSFIAQTVRTNNADVVAPGAEKPTSVYTVKAVKGELKVYAHMSEPVGKYLLADNADLAAFLDAELRNGIIRKLNVDATTAFSTASGIQTQAFFNSAADSIYAGISKVTSLGHDVAALVLPVADYDAIRLSKEEGTGRYLGGSPFDGGDKAPLWGVTTVLSPDLPTGKALVLGADSVGISTDRAGIVTEWNPYAHFSTNEVVARTEGRFAFDVQRPEAIALVTTKAA